MTPDNDAILTRLKQLRERSIRSYERDSNEQAYLQMELIDIITDIQEQEK